MKKTLFLMLLLIATVLQSQERYIPTNKNLKDREWFENAKFGMFVHWGVYSVLGSGEWVMNNRNIDRNDYKVLLKLFNPEEFNAKKWVSTAKEAGMKYITFTTRHHDGFCNWDTKQTDWKITNTPYGKDILKQLAKECKRQDIKLFLYYSLIDWYRSDYPYETGKTGHGTGRTEKSNYDNYLKFMKAQLTELLTNYGEIAGIWFDGHWDQLDKEKKSKIDWRYNEIYTLIHSIQPQCLIGNNHHLSPITGEDFQMFERDLPGENKSGMSGQSVSKLPLETCETLNKSWGFDITDHKYKSTKEIVNLLVRASGYGANLLLNVGPLPNGEIQTQFTSRLKEVGKWLKTNGESIYGTKGGFLRPQPWGAITEKEDKIYIHILNFSEKDLKIKIPFDVKSAKLFGTDKTVSFEVRDNEYLFKNLDKILINSNLDNIIELTK